MAKKTLNLGFTGDVAEETGVAVRAKSAANRIKDEAGMVAAHAADHPAVTGSAVVAVGLVAFALGYLLGNRSGAARSGLWPR
ncbi:hypothetical protein [Neorhizobium alkalisoli]|uniref:Uncharacterized protein n=1 Tax=Neorhizobium alkalisoli TaxID=528178 RepID=A0A561QR99_9HYPH|nr:hypothetical protein [Neorhizobium alkalisoli]TWF52874.1 hypothetical protein FHW37_104142 [Neorhizobium alkalisoli]